MKNDVRQSIWVKLAQIMAESNEPEAADIIDQQITQTPKYSLDALRGALTALDAKLTGRVPNTKNYLLECLYDGQEYYLSDGGYSRVVMSPAESNYDSLKLFLTSNSTDHVKSQWESAQNERNAVLAAANALYNEEANSQLQNSS